MATVISEYAITSVNKAQGEARAILLTALREIEHMGRNVQADAEDKETVMENRDYLRNVLRCL